MMKKKFSSKGDLDFFNLFFSRLLYIMNWYPTKKQYERYMEEYNKYYNRLRSWNHKSTKPKPQPSEFVKKFLYCKVIRYW